MRNLAEIQKDISAKLAELAKLRSEFDRIAAREMGTEHVEVAKLAAIEFGVSIERIMGRGKSVRECEARYAAWWTLFNFGDSWSQSRISKVWDGREHSAVCYGLQKANEFMACDAVYRAKVVRVQTAFRKQ